MYVNTMVFAVVAVITVIVLLTITLLFNKSKYVRMIKPFIITVVLGLLGVVIYALLKINVYEHDTKELMDKAEKNILSATSCPDYFTSKNVDGEIVCQNNYKAPRSDVEFKFIDNGDRKVPSNDIILSEYQDKTMGELCKKVNPQEPSNNMYNIPWTDIRAKCRSLTTGYYD